MTEPQFKTKQKRLVAIVDRYSELHGRRSVTMEEVSEWAVANGLFPVPVRGCSIDVAIEWETRLMNATL